MRILWINYFLLFLIIYFIKQQYCFPYSFPKLLWNLYIIFLNLYFLIKFFFEIIYYQFFIFLSNLLIFHLYLFLRWVAGTSLIHWHVILTKFFIRYFSCSSNVELGTRFFLKITYYRLFIQENTFLLFSYFVENLVPHLLFDIMQIKSHVTDSIELLFEYIIVLQR